MDKYQQGFIWAAILALLIINTQCARPAAEPQRSETQAGSSVTIYKKPLTIQGKVEGKVLPFSFTDRDLRAAVLSHPTPDVWLIYPTLKGQREPQNAGEACPTARVELPLEARRVLTKHWETALSAQYDWEMKYESDVEKRTQLSIAIVNSSQNAALELTKTLIDAPDGRRPISMGEANDLVQFIGHAVIEVIEQARASEATNQAKAGQKS